MIYKCVIASPLALARVINYSPRLMPQTVASLTDDSRSILVRCLQYRLQHSTAYGEK
jgi:hypothetical protein